MKLKRKNSGFSLIELMVVVSIMAILATAGLTGYSSAQKKARDSRRKGDIRTIQNMFVSTTDSGGNYAIEAALSDSSFPVDPSSTYHYIIVGPSKNSQPGTELGKIEGLSAEKVSDTAITNFENSITKNAEAADYIYLGLGTANGGFACAWMESGSGGNAGITGADGTADIISSENPFFAQKESLSDSVLFGDNRAIFSDNRQETYYINSDCGSDCNVFCAVF